VAIVLGSFVIDISQNMVANLGRTDMTPLQVAALWNCRRGAPKNLFNGASDQLMEICGEKWREMEYGGAIGQT